MKRFFIILTGQNTNYALHFTLFKRCLTAHQPVQERR